MDDKACPGCNARLPVTEFNWKFKARGIRQVRCQTCTRAQVRSHYDKHRAHYIARSLARNAEVLRDHQSRVLAYLATHACVDCGEADPVCLEFDHVRGDKLDEVCRMMGHCPWRVIAAEIEKCDVRCANCHRRKTARAAGWYRTLEVGS